MTDTEILDGLFRLLDNVGTEGLQAILEYKYPKGGQDFEHEGRLVVEQIVSSSPDWATWWSAYRVGWKAKKTIALSAEGLNRIKVLEDGLELNVIRVNKIVRRMEFLERDSHPPLDLEPAILACLRRMVVDGTLQSFTFNKT